MVEDIGATKSIAKGAILVFVGLIIGRLLGYLTRLVVARHFDPAGYGLLSLAMSVFSIASIVGLMGLQAGMLRFVPDFAGRNQKEKIRPALYYAIKLSVPVSVAISALVFFFSENISLMIFHNSDLIPILRIFSIAIPLSVVSSLIIGAIMGLRLVKYRLYLDDIIKPISRILPIVVFIAMGFGLEWVAVAYNISFLVPLIFGFYIFFKITRGKTGRLEKSDKKDIFSYSWPTMLASLVFIIMGQIDSIMLGIFKTPADVGIYNAALPTVDIMVVVHVALTSLFLPVLSEMHAKGRLETAGKLYKRVIKWLLMMAFPIFIIFSVFPFQTLGILFGGSYVDGALALAILSAGYLVNVVLYSSNDILNMFKKTRYQLYTSVLAVSVNIVLDYLLIPRYGIVGAAIATAIAYAFLGSFVTFLAFRVSRFNPFSGHLFRVFLSGTFTFFTFYLTSLFVGISSLVFIIAAICVMIVYSGSLLVFRAFDRDDIEMVLAIERKVGIKIPFVRNVIKRFV